MSADAQESARPNLEVLPGPTYGALYSWSTRVYLAFLLPFFGVVFESFIPVPGWTATMLLLCAVCSLVALYLNFAALGVNREERDRGYTTQLGPAIRRPELFLVHPKTKEIISRPGESRPKRIP
jgi:hypothetical protein